MTMALDVRVGLIADDSGQRLDPTLRAMLPAMFRDIALMLNDAELKAKIDRQFYSGALMSDVRGFDWYMDPDKP